MNTKTHIIGSIAAAMALVATASAGETAVSAAVADAFSLWGHLQPQVQSKELAFTPISVPMSNAEKAQNRASTSVLVNGGSYPIGYHVLMRTNDRLPRLAGPAGETETFGLLKLADGSPLLQEDGSPWVCSNDSGPDHTGFFKYGNSLFAITHLECTLGGAYVTKLSQGADGTLSSVATRSVDFSGVFGTYVNCAGMNTPWNTFLGSEEYEPPMANFNAAAQDGAWFSDPTWHDLHMATIAQYNGLPNDASHAAYFGYYYGWTPEIGIISEDGDTQVQKHFAMGRFAHELAYVLPDQRTVYLSDDGTNVGLFLFVADRAADLSAGTLYAARWNQTSNQGAGAADLQWINLGHASDAEIRAALDAGTTFDDMWEQTDPLDAATGTCPAGFTSTNTYDAGFHCVKLKAGADTLASRLESRLYAAYLNATLEFRKEEGITFNPEDNVLYVAMTEVAKGMEDGASQDKGGPNHIRLAKNSCGAVYGLDVRGGVSDSAGQPIDSSLVAIDMYGLVVGETKDYSGTDLAENSCDMDKIANPDNLSYLPGYGTLLIGEDTGKHQNDALWAYDVKTGRLDRIATTPYGSETTSPYWFPNIDGSGYVTMVTQHPYGESDGDLAQSPSDKESYVGYIGPFPPLD